jgi:hypothetical protein
VTAETAWEQCLFKVARPGVVSSCGLFCHMASSKPITRLSFPISYQTPWCNTPFVIVHGEGQVRSVRVTDATCSRGRCKYSVDMCILP